MTTADWALVISIISALVSAAGFAWNIWSKFIYPKPRIDVSFRHMLIVQPGSHAKNRIAALTAINMGPVTAVLHSVTLCDRRWGRNRNFAVPMPLIDPNIQETLGPFSGGLPKTLAVGEQFCSYFAPDAEWLTSGEFRRIGFHDTFGRTHWTTLAAPPKTSE